MEKPNSREQILKDLLSLIREKILEGYRPVLMMDANGGDNYDEGTDHDFRKFIDAYLHEREKETQEDIV